MTMELEPCPFCPEGVLPVRLKKDGKPTGIVAHACYALGREIRVPEHVWNTRYKRTCKPYQTPDGWTCPVCNWSGLNWGVQKCCSGCGTQLDWR